MRIEDIGSGRSFGGKGARRLRRFKGWSLCWTGKEGGGGGGWGGKGSRFKSCVLREASFVSRGDRETHSVSENGRKPALHNVDVFLSSSTRKILYFFFFFCSWNLFTHQKRVTWKRRRDECFVVSCASNGSQLLMKGPNRTQGGCQWWFPREDRKGGAIRGGLMKGLVILSVHQKHQRVLQTFGWKSGECSELLLVFRRKLVISWNKSVISPSF